MDATLYRILGRRVAQTNDPNEIGQIIQHEIELENASERAIHPMSKSTNTDTSLPTSLNAAQDRRAAERAQSDADQQSRINSGPGPRDPFDVSDSPDNGFEAGAQAMAQFVAWQGNVLSRLGLTSLTGDVKADNPTLLAALTRIAAAGAPAPSITRETVAWPGGPILAGGAFTVDVYEFVHPHEPQNIVRSSEFLMAANPVITIGELVKARIISDPNA